MNLRRVLVFALIVLLALAIIVMYEEQPQPEPAEQPISFEPTELSSAGGYGYVVYSANSSSSINILALTEKPIKKIYILDKSIGIGIETLADFIYELNSLEEYGFSVKTVSSVSSVSDNSLIVIAQGAMPESVLPLLEENITILYIGKTDALLLKGVVHEEWYSSLDGDQKAKIVLYNSTLDDLYNEGKVEEIKNTILFNGWAAESNKTHTFSEGKGTVVIPLEEASYLRIIYPTEEGYKIADSKELFKPGQILTLPPSFPSEKQSLYLTFEGSKGIPKLSVYKDGLELYEEKLGTVGQDVFYKSLSFGIPGEYILRVKDYEGEIASGILHVKDLQITYTGSDGWYYTFYITLDGTPVNGEEATVHLQDSNKSMVLFISNGILSVPATLKKGTNIFVIELYEQEFYIDVEYAPQGVLDVYLQYGPWAALAIIIINLVVLFTKKHPYKLKFDSVISPSSGEVKASTKKIQKILQRAVSEFGINGCINAREFSLALRKYITDGNDVMDGNAEAILKKLEKKDYLESYKSFYKLKGKEGVKKAVMDRLIREKLIEQGISFKYHNGVFHTKEQYILFGKEVPKTRGKVALVFESRNAVLNYLESLPQKIQAKTALKIRNDSLLLLSIDELAEYL